MSKFPLAQIKVVRVQEMAVSPKMDAPEIVTRFWKRHIAKETWFDPAKEAAIVVILNTRYRAIGWNLIGLGTLNESILHPREVLRPVIALSGYAFIVAHNHPSGNSRPSRADRDLTKRLAEAGALMQIFMLDHIIVGRQKSYSFARRKWRGGYF